MRRALAGGGAVLARWRAEAEQRGGDFFKVEGAGKGAHPIFVGVERRVVVEELCGGELQLSQVPWEGYGLLQTLEGHAQRHAQRGGYFPEVKQEVLLQSET